MHIKISVFPPKGGRNEFIDRNLECLDQLSYIELDNLPTVEELKQKPFFYFRNFRTDVILINWLENILINKRGNFSIIGFLRYLVFFSFCKHTSKHVFYIRHNIYPHNASGFSARIVEGISNIFEKLCNKRISLSGHLIEKGYQYVPHPLYTVVSNYQSVEPIEDYYIIFGRIERYKKIEDIVEAWDLAQKLIIAGPANDHEYLEHLKLIAKGKNIEFKAYFIEDDEAQDLIINSKGMLLVNCSKEMIVSGSFFYAASLGVRVFAVQTPFFIWLNKENQFSGLFVYESVNSLISSINEQNFTDTTKDRILSDAHRLFGDEAVIKAWHALLKDSI